MARMANSRPNERVRPPPMIIQRKPRGTSANTAVATAVIEREARNCRARSAKAAIDIGVTASGRKPNTAKRADGGRTSTEPGAQGAHGGGEGGEGGEGVRL